MEVMETKELPINCVARNSVWIYPRATPPPFNGAPIIYETAHSHERPDIFSLPEGSDVTVELYGGAVVLRLEGELRRVHIRRFDHITFPTEEEARHAFMQLWREVEMLESATAIELAAERWLEANR
ncbi:MAG TPA: hypothetical protein VIQ24_20190 [Pyrinomonadaceae bacterium]